MENSQAKDLPSGPGDGGEKGEVVETAEASSEKSFSEMQEGEVPEVNMSFFNTLSGLKFPDLSDEQEAQLKDMLWEERGAFSQGPEDIGCVPDLVLHLRTEDEVPVQKNYNAIPKPLYPEVRDHIQGMLERGWIKKSESNWASPIVLVKKKTGSFRVCCDFRSVNKKTYILCPVYRMPWTRFKEASILVRSISVERTIRAL
jgi:hypothetical protein